MALAAIPLWACAERVAVPAGCVHPDADSATCPVAFDAAGQPRPDYGEQSDRDSGRLGAPVGLTGGPALGWSGGSG